MPRGRAEISSSFSTRRGRVRGLRTEGGLCALPGADRCLWEQKYAVVAQYSRPPHDESCFYNGKAHWEPSWPTAGVAGCFGPFAVCVVSKLPYYNALKDCLSCLLTHLKLCKDFEVDNHIKDFAAKLSLTPSPPPGPLHLVIKSGILSFLYE
ncbi:DENN domain-containing protein 3-like isoform X1 [Ursus arctos]|uniref:DENN domain-containing protein 3-like isoform X1 n=1 Tax=Ursus arctos TaxID=9644 RepID=UPI002549148C|nr:DENN domain-containing protein 3-like isoform X1 [Ursus arctos]